MHDARRIGADDDIADRRDAGQAVVGDDQRQATTILHPPDAGAGDFYYSAIDTQMDSDHTRRILEAREVAARKAAEAEAEAAFERKDG